MVSKAKKKKHYISGFKGKSIQTLRLISQIEAFSTLHEESKRPTMSVEEVAMGFIRVANEAMCRPIRALTQVC